MGLAASTGGFPVCPATHDGETKTPPYQIASMRIEVSAVGISDAISNARLGKFVEGFEPRAALRKGNERQHDEAEQHRRIDHEVDGVPAVIRKQLARGERAEGHQADY